MSSNAFQPVGNSAEIDVSSTSSTAIQVKGPNNNATQRMFYNGGTKDCWIAWSMAATAAAAAAAVIPTNGTPANGIAIAAGAIIVMGIPPNAWITAICGGSDSTKLYITPGEGN